MATSASDRYEKARHLIAEWTANQLSEEHTVKDYEQYEDEQLRLGEAAVALLREFITTERTHESEEEVAERVLQAQAGTDIRNIMAHAVHAGVQLALESWEPDERAPEPRIEIDMSEATISFNVEEGFVIEFDSGDREIVLDVDSRSDLMLALDEADQTPLYYSTAVAAARHKMNERIDAAMATIKKNEEK